MDEAEVLVNVQAFKDIFESAIEYAEMVLNSEIVNSEVIHMDDSDIYDYQQELILGYILCQEDIKTTIYSFFDKNDKMFINVDSIFEELEKAFILTDGKINLYIEGQVEKDIPLLKVAFQDTGENMEVAKYGASLFRACVVNSLTETIIKKIMEED